MTDPKGSLEHSILEGAERQQSQFLKRLASHVCGRDASPIDVFSWDFTLEDDCLIFTVALMDDRSFTAEEKGRFENVDLERLTGPPS